jgi:hydroxypyruvate reductase
LPIREFLHQGIAGVIPETPKPGAPCFARVDTRIIGNGATALATAAAYVKQCGLEPVVMGDHFVGEARDLARAFAMTAREIRARRHPSDLPVVLLSGGEAQVTVRGMGRGGRNGEFLLALALEDLDGVHALAADTDGIDGSAENAGALLAPDTLPRAAALGLDARAPLDDNDAYGFFSALGDLVVTGPTRTNANDFRAILLT